MRVFDLDGDHDPPSTTENMRTHAETEWKLEELLNANHDLLLDQEVLVFGRQYQLESGILDLLALDQFGNTVVFEIKRGESGSGSASEETILSQPQNYAQSLSTYDYNDLNEIYHEYRTADWHTAPVIKAAETLEEAFEKVFGTTLEPNEYNEYQRMVILAETITRRTMMNARYLLEEGLNVQCVEIQQFEAKRSTSTIATATVVDYSLERVQPEREGPPIYPEVAKDLAKRAFPEVSDLVNANTYHDVFESFEGYEPGLRSKASSHPDSVKYVFHLRPLEWGAVHVALQIRGGDDAALQTVRKNAAKFEEQGFSVNQTRKRDRIVTQVWEADTPSHLSNEEFANKLATRFATLVQTGHEIFETAQPNE